MDMNAFSIQYVSAQHVAAVQYLISTRGSLKSVLRAFVARYPIAPADWGRLLEGLSDLIFYLVKTDSKDPLNCADGIHNR